MYCFSIILHQFLFCPVSPTTSDKLLLQTKASLCRVKEKFSSYFFSFTWDKSRNFFSIVLLDHQSFIVRILTFFIFPQQSIYLHSLSHNKSNFFSFFFDAHCHRALGIGHLIPQCFLHTLCPWIYGSWHWLGIGFKDYRGSLGIMGYWGGSGLLRTTRGLFGKQRTVPYCDRFCYGNNLPPGLKRKGNCHLYGERNGAVVFKDQDSSVQCVSIEFVRFEGFFGVTGCQKERFISLPVFSQPREWPTSPPFFHVLLRLETVAVAPLFFPSFVLSLSSNNNEGKPGGRRQDKLHYCSIQPQPG